MLNPEELKVYIRVRPSLSNELKYTRAVSTTSNSINVVSEKGQVSCSYDYVFGEFSDQKDVFNKVKPLLSNVLSGYNACLFAYGQTSAGKSHTMLGPDGGQELLEASTDDWGILPRAAEFLFGELADRAQEGSLSYQVKASFLQIYNETLYDLLRDSTHDFNVNRDNGLKIRELPSPLENGVRRNSSVVGEVYVSGLSEYRVQTSDDVIRILMAGTANRATRSTDYNMTSSRSHAILQLTFDIEIYEESGATSIRRSKLSLVDLAGSEKMQVSTSESVVHVKELTSINKSLMCLGNVISALSSRTRTHIPYRDSKLTRLLQDSLGGNTRTVFIACIAPTLLHAAETINTLAFADRAKSVILRVRANVVVSDKALLQKAEEEIQRLSALLKEALGKAERGSAGVGGGVGSSVGEAAAMDALVLAKKKFEEDSVALRRENHALKTRLQQLEQGSRNCHCGAYAVASESTSSLSEEGSHFKPEVGASNDVGVGLEPNPSRFPAIASGSRVKLLPRHSGDVGTKSATTTSATAALSKMTGSKAEKIRRLNQRLGGEVMRNEEEIKENEDVLERVRVMRKALQQQLQRQFQQEDGQQHTVNVHYSTNQKSDPEARSSVVDASIKKSAKTNNNRVLRRDTDAEYHERDGRQNRDKTGVVQQSAAVDSVEDIEIDQLAASIRKSMELIGLAGVSSSTSSLIPATSEKRRIEIQQEERRRATDHTKSSFSSVAQLREEIATSNSYLSVGAVDSVYSNARQVPVSSLHPPSEGNIAAKVKPSGGESYSTTKANASGGNDTDLTKNVLLGVNNARDNAAPTAATVVGAATADPSSSAPVPAAGLMQEHPLLDFSIKDVGTPAQLFSFRLNSWETIELLDFEPTRGLHKCRHPDGTVQWLDLRKKPIRASIAANI